MSTIWPRPISGPHRQSRGQIDAGVTLRSVAELLDVPVDFVGTAFVHALVGFIARQPAGRALMLARVTNFLKRTFGLTGRRGHVFDAAGHGDRWPLSSQIWSPVSQSLAAAQPISTRADWLANNSPTAAAYLQCWIDNLVATGPTVRSQHPDEATRRVLEKSWNRFAMRCDAEGVGDLTGFLAKVTRNWVITGESFVQMPIVERRLKLRLINTEQVWRPLTRVQPNGHRIFSGIEVDEAGKALAYWTLRVQMDLPWAVFPLP